MNIDFSIFQSINQFAGKWPLLDTLAVFFASYFGYFLISFLLLFLLKNYKKYSPLVIQALASAVLARFLIVNLIRWFWERPRPFIASQVKLLLSHEATGSFPSGQAAFYFAIATIAYLYNKKIGILFFIGSFLIGFARVFAGIHWPLDIIAGALVGIFSGWLIARLFKKIKLSLSNKNQ